MFHFRCQVDRQQFAASRGAAKDRDLPQRNAASPREIDDHQVEISIAEVGSVTESPSSKDASAFPDLQDCGSIAALLRLVLYRRSHRRTTVARRPWRLFFTPTATVGNARAVTDTRRCAAEPQELRKRPTLSDLFQHHALTSRPFRGLGREMIFAQQPGMERETPDFLKACMHEKLIHVR